MPLTATLNDVQNQVGVIRPADRGPSALSQIANTAGGLINAFSQKAATERQNEVYALQKSDRAALNDAEQTAFDSFKNAQTPTALGGVSATPDVPQDVVAAADRLSSVQGAVNQGSTPSANLDLHLETAVDTLFQKHPESKAVIAQYMQSRGFDHYLFRDVKNQLQQQQNAVEQQQAAEKFVYDTAVQKGLVLPTTDRATAILRGQEYLKAESLMAQTKTQLDMLKTQTDIDETIRKRQETIGHTNLVSASIGDAANRVGTVVEAFGTMTTEALNDPTGKKYKELQESIPLLNQGIQTAKVSAMANVYAHNGGKEQADAVGAYYDNMAQSMTAVYTGELSKVKLNQQVLLDMQTQFGIDAGKAFPLWMELSKLPGMANALPLLFGGDPAHSLSAEQQKAITKELNGWAPGSTEGMYHIQRVAGVLRGDLKLTAMPQEQAQKTIPTLITAVQGNRAAINNGDLSPSATTGFLNGFANLDEAAFALQPGSPLSSQKTAAALIAHPDSYNALVALIKNPQTSEQALATMMSNRATSAKGLSTAKMTGSDVDSTGILSLRYNPNKMIYEVVGDRKKYDKWAKSFDDVQAVVPSEFDTLPMRAPTFEEVLRKGDSRLSDKASIQNNYLSNLVRTSPYDSNLPKGSTPKSIAAFYAVGTPLSNAAGKPIEADFGTRLSQLRAAATNITLDTVEGDTVQAITKTSAAQYGIPESVAQWMIGAEGTGPTQIKKADGSPASSASGYGQFILGTAKRFGLVGEGFDHRNDPTKAIPASMKYLRELIDQNDGDIIKALHQYGTLDRRNFKTDEAYNARVQSARNALGG